MKKTERLSLSEFKAKADQVNVVEKLEALKGGNLNDCHGFWGSIGKAFRSPSEGNAYYDAMIRNEAKSPLSA